MTKPNENQANVTEGEVITGNTQEDFKQRAKRFQQDFQALCEKHGCQLVVTPQFVSTNHGSFEVALQTSVGELPKR